MSSARETSAVNLRINPAEISMIADDLAGACDTGIEFLDSVGCVTVVVDSDLPGMNKKKSDGLVVWNTESRSLSEQDAYDKVRRACGIGEFAAKRILLKKTDSAFRGHFGREISAVMDALRVDSCCVAPAIPDFGRVTRNGIQYLNDRPIAESFYSKDPRQPVAESRVAEIIAIGTKRPTGVLDLEALRSHENKKHIEQLIASGVQLIVADSETRGDLERAVELFLGRPGRLFFVGGQGVGSALAKYCLPCAKLKTWTKVPDGAVLIVCGTLHPQAREQLKLFSQTHAIEPVFLGVDDDHTLAAVEAAAENAAAGLTAQIESHGLGLLASPQRPARVPRLVEQGLSLAAGKVYEKAALSGLILTGGTTAYEVCRRIGVNCLQLRERISWGVVLAQTPDLSGMAVAVKGGSLGDADAIQKVVDAFRSLA